MFDRDIWGDSRKTASLCKSWRHKSSGRIQSMVAHQLNDRNTTRTVDPPFPEVHIASNQSTSFLSCFLGLFAIEQVLQVLRYKVLQLVSPKRILIRGSKVDCFFDILFFQGRCYLIVRISDSHSNHILEDAVCWSVNRPSQGLCFMKALTVGEAMYITGARPRVPPRMVVTSRSNQLRKLFIDDRSL